MSSIHDDISNDGDDDQQFDTIPEGEMVGNVDNITIGHIFEKDENGKPIRFNSKKDRTVQGLPMSYEIPIRQRYGAEKWSDDKKKRLINSVFRNFPIGGITVSQQVHTDGRTMFRTFEDGASRATVLEEFYNDGFHYAGKLFSELKPRDQRRFEQYRLNMEVLTGVNGQILSDELLCESFNRINSGVPLKDEDRFWNMQTISPLIALSIKATKQPWWPAHIMKTVKFGQQNRKCLPEVVAMVATLAFGTKYTSVSAKRLDEILLKPIDEPEQLLNTIRQFCEHYSRIIRRTEETSKTFRCQLAWHKTSKSLGLILHDFLDEEFGESLEDKEDMWVEVMTIAQTSENFMFGDRTIWNGLGSSAKANNTDEKDFKKKLDRIREFYFDETRAALCTRYNIVY
jgi:hypothetical protein